ncbi:DUF4186 family protein [Aureimonas jatrophae]|uniref:DUF4186 domain-containing protein n=1 Tax=Aureimonas jatrophae TaxID=1166073 RepID=A0A1H0IU32_9HYPH|nr:DUF4186 family protein [Aureimonas jatrophae]MBB3952362.1 hypothetical protein [Aureimonas jatrophae]SDO34882.1 protein of unknown function [Aureimonas jatrophae]
MNDLTSRLDEPLPQIKITCTSVDCENDLHCFLQKRRSGNKPAFGPCRACDADLVDWQRAHERDPDRIDALFADMRTEKIREHMWSQPFDGDALRKVRKHDRQTLHAKVRKRIASSVGKSAGVYDGRQTAMKGDVVLYAQHATATCCRQCILYWHGIPKNVELKDDEKEYLCLLVDRYLDARVGDDMLRGS